MWYFLPICGKQNPCTEEQKTVEANSKNMWKNRNPGDVAFWDLTDDNFVSHNRFKVPILRSMYRRMQCLCPEAKTYTYVNPDLIPANNLENTLEFVNVQMKQPYMIVGRRYDVDWKNRLPANLSATISNPFSEQNNAINSAMDYFVVSRKAIDWNKVPDFVAGRDSYQNWLVEHVHNKANTTLVDASRTLKMLHMTTGKPAPQNLNPYDLFFNKRLAFFPSVDGTFKHGTPDVARFYTDLDQKTGQLLMKERSFKYENIVV